MISKPVFHFCVDLLCFETVFREPVVKHNVSIGWCFENTKAQKKEQTNSAEEELRIIQKDNSTFNLQRSAVSSPASRSGR